jgi:hypothetical protein
MFTLWILAQLSPGVVRGVKETWRTMRGPLYDLEPQIIAAVDQPTDPLISLIAGLSKIPEETLAVLLPRTLHGIADALDEALSSNED